MIFSIACILLFVSSIEASNWYYDNWCGEGLTYLDDAACQKIFPKEFSRDWQCPNSLVKSPPAFYQAEGLLSDMNVDTTILGDVITDPDVNLCIVLTKRVLNSTNSQGFSLYHRYLCAGDRSMNTGYETWSSSKIFAMANAGGHLRSDESQCGSGNNYNYLFGLDGSVEGKHGVTPLGDLATVVCSYDTTAGYSSNSLSSYFHDIGWRDRINDLLVNWLQVSNQTLGGNYGEATPSDLSMSVNEINSESNQPIVCPADKDPWPTKYDNTITSLTAVELTRRIAQHRELLPELRYPGLQWKDIQSILYGAESSVLFEGLQWGGMTSDTAIFLQMTQGITSKLQSTDSNLWRIFSKLGAGYSSSRSRGEIVTNAYACIPQINEQGQIIDGLEVTINARGSVPYDSSLTRVEQKVYNAVNQAIDTILTL